MLRTLELGWCRTSEPVALLELVVRIDPVRIVIHKWPIKASWRWPMVSIASAAAAGSQVIFKVFVSSIGDLCGSGLPDL